MIPNGIIDVPEVKSAFRLLATLRSLGLIGTEAFMASANKNKVAKLFISRILEEPDIIVRYDRLDSLLNGKIRTTL